ncbi:MAG: uridylate kinase [Clostridia bacterium]|jgi:glutamate 5-kinase|nr:uridylate kinase [Clostridia bacterium]
MKFDTELVGKIGSMALIDKADNLIDYTRVARLSRELRPGYVWISSGATEIGRLDYLARNGKELNGEFAKTDYSSQGQAILMQTYRQFIDPRYSVRQILVEHRHFNDEQKSEHLRALLLRCEQQNAIPIINYNDAISNEENRRLEITSLMHDKKRVYECVDNDETASRVACLVRARVLLIFTSVNGIYTNPEDPATLVPLISGKNDLELIENIEAHKRFCAGASRAGANGAKAKLEYIKDAAAQGTTVYIANACYSINDVLKGEVPCTKIGIDLTK